jgi:peptidoglycan/xylan/chitin deacetylase (PgdA/CDA1 family)
LSGARQTLPGPPGAIALTFDDGPDPVFTDAVLGVLAELGVLATFFMVGSRAERHPEIVRRVLGAGHQIGSHTATHPDMWELSFRQAVDEYQKGRRVLESIAGRPVRLFRPPKGSINRPQAMAIRALGLRAWLWSVDTMDWEPHATASSIVGSVGRLGNGDVVLFHDAIEKPIAESSADRSATVEALPGVVRAATDAGLSMLTLS